MNIIIWGAGAKLAGNDTQVQSEIMEMLHQGITIEACKDCCDNFGVSERLEKLGVTVRYMGQSLTEYIKSGEKILTILNMKKIIITTGIFITMLFLIASCTNNKRMLEVRYLKEGKLIMETIPLDFIDADGRLESLYIDTIRFCRLDSMAYTDNHPDRDVQYTTPVALDLSKQIQPQSPEYYSAFTIHYTSKAIEYYNRLFGGKIDFDYKPEYRTIEVCFGDFPGNTTPDFYIYAQHSTPSPSICFHEVGHRAFWYIQNQEKGLGVRFKGLSIVHMGLLEYFTVSLNDSPVVGEDCLPVKMIRDASRIYNYPLNGDVRVFDPAYSNAKDDAHRQATGAYQIGIVHGKTLMPPKQRWAYALPERAEHLYFTTPSYTSFDSGYSFVWLPATNKYNPLS